MYRKDVIKSTGLSKAIKDYVIVASDNRLNHEFHEQAYDYNKKYTMPSKMEDESDVFKPTVNLNDGSCTLFNIGVTDVEGRGRRVPITKYPVELEMSGNYKFVPRLGILVIWKHPLGELYERLLRSCENSNFARWRDPLHSALILSTSHIIEKMRYDIPSKNP